jgi:hypothetical protein
MWYQRSKSWALVTKHNGLLDYKSAHTMAYEDNWDLILSEFDCSHCAVLSRLPLRITSIFGPGTLGSAIEPMYKIRSRIAFCLGSWRVVNPMGPLVLLLPSARSVPFRVKLREKKEDPDVSEAGLSPCCTDCIALLVAASTQKAFGALLSIT